MSNNLEGAKKRIHQEIGLPDSVLKHVALIGSAFGRWWRRADLRSLLLGFESLGANCEFGLVQRHFQADPPGLLRFRDVGIGVLIAAARVRFEKMGDPEMTRLDAQFNGEFILHDRRWHLPMHTFMFHGQTDPDELLPKLTRHVAFLKEKLLADFAEARKVFVYFAPSLGSDELDTLHRVLKTLGDVRLLHVRTVSLTAPGIPTGAAGEVVKIAKDLYVGFLSREGRLPDDNWDIRLDEWIAICRGVRARIGGRLSF
jgi:hypothetical protein